MVELELCTEYHSQSSAELASDITERCGLRSTELVCRLYGMASMQCKERKVSSECVWYTLLADDADSRSSVFLHAIFPSITKIPNIMGTKSALTSGQMLCFFVYWMINCAFLFVPVPRMKKLVYVKTIVFFLATIAYVIWIMQVGGLDSSTISQPSVASGAGKKWLIVQFFFLGIAQCGTFISNAADLQRYARKPNDTLLGQIVSFPLSNCLVGVLGNLIAVATKPAFGKVGLILIYLLHGVKNTDLSLAVRMEPAHNSGQPHGW
jgi:cytosine/uracil/thiamine/allantoin permease